MIKKEKANAPHNCKIAIYHLQVTIGVAISVFFFFFLSIVDWRLFSAELMMLHAIQISDEKNHQK